MLVLVFAREISEPLTGLVKKIDDKVNEAAPKYNPRPGQKLGAFFIIPDAAGRIDQLHGMAQAESLKRVTLSIGNPTPRYEINPAAYVTILIYTPGRPGQNRVAANFTLRESDLDDCMTDEVITALANVLPK